MFLPVVQPHVHAPALLGDSLFPTRLTRTMVNSSERIQDKAIARVPTWTVPTTCAIAWAAAQAGGSASEAARWDASAALFASGFLMCPRATGAPPPAPHAALDPRGFALRTAPTPAGRTRCTKAPGSCASGARAIPEAVGGLRCRVDREVFSSLVPLWATCESFQQYYIVSGPIFHIFFYFS
jgi:hypothetical protein